LADLVDDVLFARLLADVCMDLYVEVSLLPEVVQQILPPFLNQFRRQATLLIDRQKFAFGLAGQLRAFDAGLNNRAAFYVEGDVSSVGFPVVIGAGHLDQNERMFIVGEPRLEMTRRILQRALGISSAGTNCSPPKSCAKRTKEVVNLPGFFGA